MIELGGPNGVWASISLACWKIFNFSNPEPPIKPILTTLQNFSEYKRKPVLFQMLSVLLITKPVELSTFNRNRFNLSNLKKMVYFCDPHFKGYFFLDDRF